jgi:glycosyltransferase involved in cell wall biosynthesis
LAVLVKRFPRLSETFVLNEILQLRALGLPIRVYAVMDPHELHAQPEAEVLRPEVRYLRSGSGWRAWAALITRAVGVALGRPRGTVRGLRFAWHRRSAATWRHLGEALVLIDDLEKEGAAHLHAHFAHGPAAIAYLGHLISGIPFSFTAHAKDLYTTPPEYVALRSRAASFVATCTAANAEYLGELLDGDREKVVVCRHGVNADRFASVERRPRPGRILSIGRLVPKKGFEVLLRALAIAADGVESLECRIVGGGPLEDDLKALAAELGLEQRVQFLGPRPQTALLEEFAAAEIFALAPVVTEDGDRDGIPNVLAEAMAAGVPLITTAISGIPEIIQHDINGLLVQPGDPVGLAEQIKRLLADQTSRARLASEGRAWVIEHCDPRESVRPLAELFCELLRPRDLVSV